jgi:DNA polymerase (family 10)
LHGCEVEVRADGSLDFPDEILAQLDIVLASLHSGLRQPPQQVTARMLRAISNPYVDLVVHPTGRLISDREGADLDMETIFTAAAQRQVALEINAHPSRLDLDDVYARRSVELGVLLSINTDAHIAAELDLLHFGVATARRGWVKPEVVINTWSTPTLLQWLNNRR